MIDLCDSLPPVPIKKRIHLPLKVTNSKRSYDTTKTKE